MTAHLSTLRPDGGRWYRQCLCGWRTKSYVRPKTSDRHMRRHFQLVGAPFAPSLTNVHPESACAGFPCVIHNPTDHSMRHLPTHWRDDKRLMERICEHACGHPDPDDLAFHVRNGREYMGIHGCCGFGCCND